MNTYSVLDKHHPLANIDFRGIYLSLAHHLSLSPNNYYNVHDLPVLDCLHSTYPFFNSEVSFFSVDGSSNITNKWPIHIDSGRRSALNIPLLNCDMQSTTYFFSEPEPFRNRIEPIHDFHISAVHGSLNLVDQFSLIVPTVINTSIPHTVHNYGIGKRIIFSWGSMLSFSELLYKLNVIY